MVGPFEFTEKEINAKVSDDRIGNYALGYISSGKQFVVCYVGRATEQGLRTRLKQHLGDHRDKFKFFKFSYSNTKVDAYLKECKNYHDFGGEKCLMNDIHPSKLEGDNTRCPFCNK